MQAQIISLHLMEGVSITFPQTETILENGEVINSGLEDTDIAIELTLYCMKTQIFIGGNKRASIIFANHFMIGKGIGLLVVPENIVPEFKSLLVAYYEGRNEDEIKAFLKEKCWRK